MSHTIYVTRIILRPLSALFGLQIMLPMEKSVTFTGTCANEIMLNGLTRSFIKAKEGVQIRILQNSILHLMKELFLLQILTNILELHLASMLNGIYIFKIYC